MFSTDGGPVVVFARALEDLEAGRKVDGLVLRCRLVHEADQLRALGARAVAAGVGSAADFERLAALVDGLGPGVASLEAGDAAAAREALWEALRGAFGRGSCE
jgi:hypothetical protein